METVSVHLLNQGGMEQLVKTLGLGGFCLAIFTILAVLAITKLASLAAALWLDGRFPEISDAMLRAFHERPGHCYLVGVVNLVVGLLIVLILLVSKIFALFGLILLVSIFVLGFAAYFVTYREVGRFAQLRPGWDTRTGSLVTGALVAEAAFLVPVLGQVLSVASLLRGFGAVTSTLVSRRRRDKQTPREATPVAE
ncbi:MAG: hypothetical protein IT365_25305 [Candidatus Hydrogenedentes bacterium]|nr:hypothetical protein [Candidatus Hydrogenedentota bacterium]